MNEVGPDRGEVRAGKETARKKTAGRKTGGKKAGRSEPVSRVLSRAVISLGRRLPAASSNLPESDGEPDRLALAVNRQLLPVWSCSQWGLPCQTGHPVRGALLPHHFTLTARRQVVGRRSWRSRGGLFSVALSRSLRMVGVTHHCVLWSPDFPRSNKCPGFPEPGSTAIARFAPTNVNCTGPVACPSRSVSCAGWIRDAEERARDRVLPEGRRAHSPGNAN
jgi:hypothetical protein